MGVGGGLVQQVLQATKNRDPEAAEWLEVIDHFDAATSAGASVSDLAQIASETSGRPVGLRDEWNGTRLAVSGGVVVEGDELFGADVLREAVACRVRGRSARKLMLANGSVLAASIETGAGRFGLAWLGASKRYQWKPVHYLVVERFAVSVTALALQRASQARARSAVDTACVERLLGGNLSDHELARASRSAGLPIERSYVAIALEQSPPNSVSQQALGAIFERAIAAAGGVARTAVIGRTSAVVALAGNYLESALARAVNDGSAGFIVRAGVGDPVALSDLARSWDHAREALALYGIVGHQTNLAHFRDLGILHLLAQIPREEIVAFELFQRLNDTLAKRGTPSDIEVLEAYLDEGTLRRTAARVFLHHTTVEHRLRRIEEQLQLDLSHAPSRFQVGLLLKLHRIVRAHDAAQR
jgi:hypothetical protein